MQFVADGLAAVAVQVNNQELAGVDARAGREGRLGEVRIIVGEKVGAQIKGIGSTVIKLRPRMVMAEAVLNAGHVVRLHLVQPEQGQGEVRAY